VLLRSKSPLVWTYVFAVWAVNHGRIYQNHPVMWIAGAAALIVAALAGGR
jgi:hypothetical protein